jgi:hypothetical protein
LPLAVETLDASGRAARGSADCRIRHHRARSCPSGDDAFLRIRRQRGDGTRGAPADGKEESTSMKKAIVCIVQGEDKAHGLVTELRNAGFTANDVSVLFPDRSGTRDFAYEHHTKAPEGATAGAGTGGILGGITGWLVGVGALAIPGLGPFIAAGPIMAALSGAAVGATVGGLTGALVGMGIPEYEAKAYEGKLRKGGVLVSVHTEDARERDVAKEIFDRWNATDVSTVTEARADVHARRVPDGRITR